jgi:hypothetical protein
VRREEESVGEVTPLSHSQSDRLLIGLDEVFNNSSPRGVRAWEMSGNILRNSVAMSSRSIGKNRGTQSARTINKNKKHLKMKLTVIKGRVMSLANEMIAICCDVLEDLLESS